MDVLIQISTVKVNKLLQKSMRKVIVCYTCLLYSNLRDESKDYSWGLGFGELRRTTDSGICTSGTNVLGTLHSKKYV